MYGSIHTHIESDKDTANMLRDSILEFEKVGCKKLVLTEHGTMSSYEDIKTTIDAINKKRKDTDEPLIDMDIIPGCEIYFDLTDYLEKLKQTSPELFKQASELVDAMDEEMVSVDDKSKHKRAHLILAAKDYTGYLSLCKLITESNKNAYVQKTSATQAVVYPLTTIDMLQKYIAKGHVLSTSACIAGPFGHLLGLELSNATEKHSKYKEILDEHNYDALKQAYDTFYQFRDEIERIKPTKEEEAEAKANKAKNELKAIKERKQKIKDIKNSEAFLAAKEAVKAADAYIKEHKLKATITNEQRYAELVKEKHEDLTSHRNQNIAAVLLKDLLSIFGEKDFYFELQNHGLPSEQEIYNNLIRFAFQQKHPHFIASNDIHVAMTKDNPDYQNALLRRSVIQFTRFKNYSPSTKDTPEYCIKDDPELKEALRQSILPITKNGEVQVSSDQIIDNAVWNIEQALSGCKVIEPPKENHYPKFCEDEDEEFERQVREGVKKKFPNGFPSPVYEERLEKELNIIKSMGYSSYLLIVNDYLTYGRLLGYLPEEEIANAPLSIEELDAYITKKGYRRVGYRIGPGRGSAAGSLACYAMGITDLDPIPYDLLFERFLNPERKSMPDIDCDFSPNIRKRVIEYCGARYGWDCICQIMTKSYGKTKGNIRLAGRYLASKECVENNLTTKAEKDAVTKKWFSVADNICKQITKDDESSFLDGAMDLVDLEDEEVEVQDADSVDYSEVDVNNLDIQEQKLLAVAKALKAPFMQFGEHAAGVIISKDKLTDIIPLMYNANKDNMSTQCNMAQAEAKGLLKMDFLGLKNLDIITRIIQTPTDEKDIDGRLQDYDERMKILNDPAIYRDIYAATLTQGIFQFESPGMKKTLRNINPTCFEDIIAAISLYRPGPMDYIPQFIVNKRVVELADRFADVKAKMGQLPQAQINNLMAGIVQDAVSVHVDQADLDKIGGIESYSKLHRLDVYRNERFFDEAKIDKIGTILQETKEAPYLGSPILKEILEPTYGVITYQEQVMLIFQKLAGYTLGGADAVRKAISKKHIEDIEAEESAFIYGDEKRNIPGAVKLAGITPEQAKTLFDTMVKFGAYAFNKSHAAAYALVSVFTAYCKKYHTEDFFKESLNAMEDQKDIEKYASEMKAFGLKLAPPSLKYSGNDFTLSPDRKTIYCGLSYIKGASSVSIIPSECLQEFVSLNPQISDKLLLCYAKLGMFKTVFPNDTIPASRTDCINWIENLYPMIKTRVSCQHEIAVIKTDVKENGIPIPIDRVRKIQQDFNQAGEQYITLASNFVRTPEDKVLDFQYERELLGTVVTAEEALSVIQNEQNDFSSLRESGRPQNIAAMVISTVERKTKKTGNTYYDVTLMDKNGATEIFHMKQIPESLYGRYMLEPKSGMFYSHMTAPITSAKTKEKMVSFNEIRKEISEGTFHPQRMIALEQTFIPGGETSIYARVEEGEDRNNGR